MLIKLKNIFYKLMSDLAISSYLPSNLFLGENSVKVPFLFKIIRKFNTQKQIPLLDKNSNKVILKKGLSIFKRKRKTLVADSNSELILHSFYLPFKKKLYEKARNDVEQQFQSENIFFPRYACKQHLGGILVVAEEKVPGVALSDCEQKVVEKFLDIYLDNVKRNIPAILNSETNRSVYNSLHFATLRLQRALPTNSSLSKLSSVCGEPFKNEKGYWPTNHCHGQFFVINILYCKSSKDKFYFIDFEPELMGQGPYAYDFAFFVLYASDLISPKYMEKMTKIIFNEQENYNWAQYFLAQIIWWSRNKSLNSSQLNKIELRSLKTLSLINKTIEH